jgi:aminoglycoside 6'-N-acetyltransferase I
MRAWANLRSELWPTCSPERHRLEIEQLLASTGLVAIAIVAGETVGFAELSIRHDHVEGTTTAPVPYLEGWYVTRPYRGKGVGTALLGFLETWARAQGYVEIASDAEIQNTESIRLHIARGFSEVGRSVHFVKKL